MYVYMHACMYACMYVCMYVCMCVCVCVCVCVCMYVCMYVCKHAFACVKTFALTFKSNASVFKLHCLRMGRRRVRACLCLLHACVREVPLEGCHVSPRVWYCLQQRFSWPQQVSTWSWLPLVCDPTHSALLPRGTSAVNKNTMTS